ncbi:hypothetical protein [uncultured Shimia sp.]|uniref:hypothetical protein n=1 Tax=uncultured Shimia sp. TaxID=573152 RepID=UPI002630793C|nr:hypothetical protein [uncultured Shimia sp.]
MRILTTALVFAVAGIAGKTFAMDNSAIQAVRSCMSETRAPGSYAMSTADAVPTVITASGGSERGAHNVNDCLQDRYSVQYGTREAVQGYSDIYGGNAQDVAINTACVGGGGVMHSGDGYCLKR